MVPMVRHDPVGTTLSYPAGKNGRKQEKTSGKDMPAGREQVAGMMGKVKEISARRFSIAPMMEWTDRHCRFFHRLLTRRALIYTEMVTTGAVIHGDRARLLGHDPAEHPVALQLGGCDPRQLAECARIAEAF